MDPHLPLIYAHRGASFDYPEMSREAYIAAVEQGADGFETDLRLTKDRKILCWHDADMKRVADCDLVIADSTFQEIREAYPVLALEELLEIAMRHKKNLALETKHPTPSGGAIERELMAQLENYREKISESGISISIMSFSWLALLRVRSSGWQRVYLINFLWQRFFANSASLGPSVSALVHLKPGREKKKIFIWTANSESDIRLCQTKRIDVMMTDRPAFARAILENA